MITRDPYGIKHAIPVGRVEMTPAEPEEFHTCDNDELVQRCLHCTRKYCSGECEFTREGSAKSRVKKKNYHEKKMRENGETEFVRKVADMILIGWCDTALARELGVTVKDIEKARKRAVAVGWLY